MKHIFPDEVLSQHVIVLGKTRSGKSSKARLIVEFLLEKEKPVTIIDPKGDWWGLKSSADGKHKGFPIVIFGGEHADVPINGRSGAAIAELVAGDNRPSLIDLGGWRIGDRTQFFIDFSEAFFKLARGERHLVIDEVHNFCPKGKVFSPQAGEMLHWANRLASEGQGKGIILIAASQRPQKVHNDFLSSCESLIACRVAHKADRDALRDWIDGNGDPEIGKQVLAEIATMPRTDAWVWSPEIDFGPKRITFPMFDTFDSFKPQGIRTAKLKGWADVDLKKVTAKLASVIEEAKANDPAELKRQIADLQKQLRAKQPPAPAPITSKQLQDEYAKGFKTGAEIAWRSGVEVMRAGVEKLAATVKMPPIAVGRWVDVSKTPETPAEKKAIDKILREHVPHRPTVSTTASSSATIGGLTARILKALAWLDDKGIAEPSRETVAAVAGVRPGSGYYNNTLGGASTAGLISYPKAGLVQLTDAGRAQAPAFDAEGEIHEQWLKITKGLERKILGKLIEEHPRVFSRDDLAAAIGKAAGSGYFNNTLGALSTLGAIKYPEKGHVALSKYVMP